MMHYIILLAFLLLTPGCNTDQQTTNRLVQCDSCHALSQDQHHQGACSACHQGKDNAADKSAAHTQLVSFPAHPDLMSQNCAPCHQEYVDKIPQTVHFTLNNSINLFRLAYGAEEKLDKLSDVPQAPLPETGLQLADDLLRRRCFRCHPFYRGDEYPLTIHGLGCAACHLDYTDGKLVSHEFQKPSDKQCLSCHYGNYVGFDYYGRFEHDFNNEYRTPYTTREDFFRPYGVEYHQLRPDVHQQKGLICIDCHTGRQLMLGEPGVRCGSCHSLNEVKQNTSLAISQTDNGFQLLGKDGISRNLPLLKHPAHFQQAKPIACQSCHAQWAYNDTEKHFFRIDADELEKWFNLSVQGSFETERIIENNTDYDKDVLPVVMSDKLTGETSPGLWIKGFVQRRWETVRLGYDTNGILTPLRPLLDYHLTWVNEEEEVVFNSIIPRPGTELLLPYVPHTTGAAGAFYMERLEQAHAPEVLPQP